MKPAKSNETQHLNGRQLAAVELIVAGATVAEVATKLRVNRCTVSTWKGQPAFRDAMTRRRAELFKAASLGLQALAESAVDTVRKELTSGENLALVALKVLEMVGIQKTPTPPFKTSLPSPPHWSGVLKNAVRSNQPTASSAS